MNAITAKYAGTCLTCGCPFQPGVSIVFLDKGSIRHASCGAPSAERRQAYLAATMLSPTEARERAKKLGLRLTQPRVNEDTTTKNGLPYKRMWTLCADIAVRTTSTSTGGSTNETSGANVKEAFEKAATFIESKQAEDDVAARIKAAVAEALSNASNARAELIVHVGDAEPVVVKTPHKDFARLLKMVAAGVNVWVAGPAGSGKTTGAQMVATALNLPFYFNGAIDSEYKLSGFVDARGQIVSTAFRKAYTEGGVYLFDECDASLPQATLAFNAALANGHCDFPGAEKPVDRHPDFRCIAAGNTWGLGATVEYVGRNKLDAAFLDRFVQHNWGYDENLELALVGSNPQAIAWCKRVQRLRATAKKRGLKVVISPRASLAGAKLLAAGMTEDEALDATVRAKLSPADWSNLETA